MANISTPEGGKEMADGGKGEGPALRARVGVGAYRFARNGTLRSVIVFAQRINVNTNDKNTVVTSAKNDI